jgi:hypothetical protein
MKNIIILFLVVFSNLANAQSTICPALNSFVGEWRYANGLDTIRIYLRANDYILTGDATANIGKLWGWHEFKRGNSVVESNYNNRYMNLPANSDNLALHSTSISLFMPQCDLTRQRLIGTIADITECYEPKVVTIQFNAAQNQLVWKQRQPTGFGFSTGCKGMTLPSDFILTKQ